MNDASHAATVSLVIPNWNGRQHLRDCLESVRNQTLPPGRTFLVDNGSTDGSLELVAKDYPWVSAIALRENAGFAVAVNKGIRASNSAFVALLNNDTQLDRHWLATMLEALRHHPEAGSAACKMLSFFQRDRIDGAGDVLTRGGAPLTRGMGEPDDGRYNTREYLFAACAGAAVYRRALFDHVGLFDEGFVSYYEDEDLAFRAQLAGFKCLYVPEAICYHKRGATAQETPLYPIRMQERNLTAFHLKNLPWQVLVVRLPVILASRIRRIYRSIRAGTGKAALEGLAEGLRLLPSLLAKRRDVQKLRTVSLSYIASFMRRQSAP
jgi:GT2 family glycosyltransferase